jgi:formylglycine-generating enzyme required for sulfatase activity
MQLPGSLLVAACLSALLLLTCDGCNKNPVSRTGFVTLKVTFEGQGRVEGIPADTLQLTGTRLTLTAVPDSGYLFVGWQGLSYSAANPLALTIQQNLSLVACFAKPPAGLVSIHANGSSFTMGSSDTMAQPYEHPVHTVHCAHDFYLSPCPVMQKEYAALMGVNPSAAAGTAGIGDSFPVFNVTWYQAVLYCNRRSKAEGYDTVYSYSAICTDTICPWVLENLSINYNRFGYRLPTEAEWEYACRAGTTTDFYWGGGVTAESSAATYAWYFANSGGQAHKVGQLKPNPLGLYDMAGNVAQWVNDWLAYYPDSAVTDPIGPSQLSQADYEASSNRPLRGGSYRLGAAYLRSSCRQGPYVTPPFADGPDIGFRVALGAFRPGAVPGGTAPAATFPITLSCDKTALLQFVGASRLKIAFVIGTPGQNRLVYLDLSQPDLHLLQCGKDSSVFGTSITPDGNFIGYSSKGEGSEGAVTPCTTTVRHLDSLGSNPLRTPGAYLPHFWASPSSAETLMIYSNGAAMNDLPAWYTERTYSRQFQGGSLGAVPTLMTPLGSYHGGLSSDGRFLGTSYTIGRAVDLQLNNPLYDTSNFYFCYPYNGYASSTLPQLCNLQMSPSVADPGEALFLDYGDPTVNTLTGTSYGLHQIIWVCDLRLLTPQQVEQWFVNPSGFYSWNYPRWSNNSLFAIAIAQSASGTSDAVYLIRRSDGAYLQVATGENLSYPALWIDPTQVSEVPDSFPWFGAYDLPAMDEGNIIYAQKLRLFWHYRQAPSVIAMGSSPIYDGFNTSGMVERTLNIASVGNADPVTNSIFAQNYILPFTPGLKVLLFDLFPGFLNQPGISIFPELDGVAQSKGWQGDSLNNFYRGGLPSQIIAKAAAFTPQVSWSGLDSSGYLQNPPAGTGWGVPEVDYGDYNFYSPAVQTSLGYLAALADSSAAHGVNLILVYMPENPGYDTTGMIGRYGPSIATYRQVVAWVDSLAGQNRYVHFWDANNFGNHDFVDSEALDCSHLNYKGGKRIAAKLDSLIRLYVH